MTPALQKPLALGADLVIHSATKYIDGQGRCLAGAIAGNNKLIDEISSFARSTGPTLSAFNAWIVFKGLETLSLRMQAHCENAKKLAIWLNEQEFVKKYTILDLTRILIIVLRKNNSLIMVELCHSKLLVVGKKLFV